MSNSIQATHSIDRYYEGKEFETKLKEKKPGQLSEELKSALNMPPLAPPPWLINMQRYGPPPSYPNLTIPGLNSPIPDGAQWGYHPGGWGRPPVDEVSQCIMLVLFVLIDFISLIDLYMVMCLVSCKKKWFHLRYVIHGLSRRQMVLTFL